VVSGRALRVSYLGPGKRLAGWVTLRASASALGARVVAVTFLLDGEPIGSDTTRPYNLDIDAGALPPGAHSIRVAAVDSLGRRITGRLTPVLVAARRAPSLVVSPHRGLRKALRKLARGNVNVRLLPGHYTLSEVSLGSNTRLVGSGQSTVITAPSGSYDGILVVDGQHVRISDLMLDGSGPGPGSGQAVEIRTGAARVRISRLEIVHVRGEGVDAWGNYKDISVQDSVITGDERAESGVTFEYGRSSDSSVIRTRVSGFRSYGIDFACVDHDDPAGARSAVALDNVITDINDPAVSDGTSEGGIWSGGSEAALIGNTIKRTGWDGIETVGTSQNVAIVANTINATGTGIYLEHSTNHSLVERNRISGIDVGINVEWRYEGIGSNGNSFLANEVADAGEGIFVDVGDDGNLVNRNVFLRVDTPVVFRGSSNNVAKGNRACLNTHRVVTESDGLGDDGTLVASTANHLSDNRSTSCSKLTAKK
jgi:hypothetical protein